MKNIKIDAKLLKIMYMVAGGFVIFIIILAMIAACSKPKMYTIANISELENKLISLAKDYYSVNADALPKEGASTTLSVSTFIEDKKIKPLNEIIENGEYCDGSINVVNNNGYYLYIPKIDCGELYKAKSLFSTLTDEKNIVTTGNGLYHMHSKYIYRGEKLNNYLSFANKTWLILSINADGTLRVLDATRRNDVIPWDDRYNAEKDNTLGINDFVTNNINSRIKDYLLEIYNNEEEFSDNDKAHLVKQDLCIGKRDKDEVINDGSIECSVTLKDEVLGLIQVNEYLQASLDANCDVITSASCLNYNYLANLGSTFWTITADKNTSQKVYKVGTSGYLTDAANFSNANPVALLTKDLLYGGGDGSIDNPYKLITSPVSTKK